VLRRLSIAVTSSLVLIFWAIPAWALPVRAHPAATSGVHTFSIPGVYGIGAWGSYRHIGGKVRVTVCVADIEPGVYGGAAAGVASAGRQRQTVAAVVVGYRHVACQTMLTRYTDHLVVDALSGNRNGTVRKYGRARQIY
jgi:hypothetical protein